MVAQSDLGESIWCDISCSPREDNGTLVYEAERVSERWHEIRLYRVFADRDTGRIKQETYLGQIKHV